MFSKKIASEIKEVSELVSSTTGGERFLPEIKDGLLEIADLGHIPFLREEELSAIRIRLEEAREALTIYRATEEGSYLRSKLEFNEILPSWAILVSDYVGWETLSGQTAAADKIAAILRETISSPGYQKGVAAYYEKLTPYLDDLEIEPGVNLPDVIKAVFAPGVLGMNQSVNIFNETERNSFPEDFPLPALSQVILLLEENGDASLSSDLAYLLNVIKTEILAVVQE